MIVSEKMRGRVRHKKGDWCKESMKNKGKIAGTLPLGRRGKAKVKRIWRKNGEKGGEIWLNY